MGMKDLPASFDYITTTTGYPKIAYIGHSQGSTQMFYALAHNEAYFSEKISVFVALAPVTKISHSKTPFFDWIAMFYDEFEDSIKALGIHYLLTKTWLTTETGKMLCETLEKPC